MSDANERTNENKSDKRLKNLKKQLYFRNGTFSTQDVMIIPP